MSWSQMPTDLAPISPLSSPILSSPVPASEQSEESQTHSNWPVKWISIPSATHPGLRGPSRWEV